MQIGSDLVRPETTYHQRKRMMKDKEYEENVKSTIEGVKTSYSTYESWSADLGSSYTSVNLFEGEKGLEYSIGNARFPMHSAEEAKRFRETGEMAYGNILGKKVGEVKDEMQEAYFRMIEESWRKMNQMRENLSVKDNLG